VVTITTGRLYSGTRRVAELCGIRGPVGCVDGAHLVTAATHLTFAHHGICGAAAEALRSSLERHGPASFLFAGDAIIHDAQGAEWLQYVATWSNELKATPRIVEHASWRDVQGVSGLVSIGTRAQIHGVLAELDPAATHAVSFPIRQQEGNWGMVVRAAGRDKGTALKEIAAHHGIAMADTVAVGDWLNDLPLLRAAGRSFAMGHAPDEVKAAATDQLPQHGQDGGGVARAIELAFGR